MCSLTRGNRNWIEGHSPTRVSPDCFVIMIIILSFPLAQDILLSFHDRFISEVDANAVVWKLLFEQIIDDGDQNEISNERNPMLKNEILFKHLKNKCTKDALSKVCDVMIEVPGNPKMKALGEDMKKRLETGK